MSDFMSSCYDMPPYRPPSEAASLLIRASRGCPWNKCSFCTMYKSLKYHPKSMEEMEHDIKQTASLNPNAKTVFIGDSDSLAMKYFVQIIESIRKQFPNIERITSYARAKTLVRLGSERLKLIRKVGLTRIHVGLESGDAKTLELMHKGATPMEMIAGGKAAVDAGLELCFYVLVGAGGRNRLVQHATGSAMVCNNVDPDFIRLRTLVVQHGAQLAELKHSGLYIPTSPLEKLEEVKLFVHNLDVNDCELASDHFTNFLWLERSPIYTGVNGVLPGEKQRMLEELNETLEFLSVIDDEVLDAPMLYDRGLITSL